MRKLKKFELFLKQNLTDSNNHTFSCPKLVRKDQQFKPLQRDADILARYNVGEAVVTIRKGYDRIYYIVEEPPLTDEERKQLEKNKRDAILRLVEPHFDNDKLAYYYRRDTQGFGKIDVLIQDEQIEDIYATVGPVRIKHRKFGVLETNITLNLNDIRKIISKILIRAKRPMWIGAPIQRFHFKNMRVSITLGDTCVSDGYYITFRKFPETPFSVIDLLKFNTLDVWTFALITLLILHKRTGIFIGAPSSGKTTALWAFLGTLPLQKIVLIQEVKEIHMPEDLWPVEHISPEKGTLHKMLEDALKGRSPSYIILGELHELEASVFLRAGFTKLGVLSTFHAEDALSAFSALTSEPISLPKVSLWYALDFIVEMREYTIANRHYRRIRGIYLIDHLSKSIVQVQRLNEPDLHSFSIAPVTVIEEYLDKATKSIPHDLDVSELLPDLAKIAKYALKKGISNFKDFTLFLWRYYNNPDKFKLLLKYVNLPNPNYMNPEVILCEEEDR